MKLFIKTLSVVAAGSSALLGGTALSQVINGGFETASGGYTTGALGWNDFSAPANNGSTASAARSLLDPFAGVAELTLAYQNSANPGIGPSVIAQSDIFGGMSPGQITLSFEAKGVTVGFENNQVQVQWFGAGNSLLGASGFQSYQGSLTPAYSLQSFSLPAPAGTTGAVIQFLEAGSAVPLDAGLTRIDNVSLGTVPEPSTLALTGLAGAAALSIMRRRK